MVTTFDMGWHRVVALKYGQKKIKSEKSEMIDTQVYLKNGLKVNIEFIEEEGFIGLVVKGNNNYKENSIIRADFDDIDNTIGRVIEIK